MFKRERKHKKRVRKYQGKVVTSIYITEERNSDDDNRFVYNPVVIKTIVINFTDGTDLRVQASENRQYGGRQVVPALSIS